MTQRSWRVSLHSGHSGEFCAHATGTLREVLEAAVAAGYHTFGVSEHVPRGDEAMLYPEERERGIGVAELRATFERYVDAVAEMVRAFEGRLIVLRGYEAELLETPGCADEMRAWRGRFDYMVGSVHRVDGYWIDFTRDEFDAACAGRGGVEALAVAYYESVAAMVEAFEPDVVGHLDLIRKCAPPGAALATPAIERAATRALEVIRAHGCVLDLNTAALRKGLDTPYPAPWLVERAHRMGIGFCLGDDSHGPDQVGMGIDAGRDYLLSCGVREATVLTRHDGEVVVERAPLGADPNI